MNLTDLRVVLQCIGKDPPPTVVVIGDVMLDRYIIGEAKRLSPEAPVPVVHQSSERESLGGAGNVVANVKGAGAAAVLVAAIGSDEEGAHVLRMLEEIGVSSAHLLTVPRATTSKTRIVAGTQQLVRLDREDTSPLEEDQERWLIEQVHSSLAAADVCIVSDYGKGVCSPELVRQVIIAAAARDVPVIIDPKGPDFARYAGASCGVPNRSEVSRLLGRKLVSDDDFAIAARELQERFQFGQVLITRSEEGMTLLTDSGVTHIPADAREVFDVSGASDTVVAVMAVALAKGADYESSASLANCAAGLVISKAGTAPIRFDELQSHILSSGSERWDAKLLSEEEVDLLARRSHSQDHRIVFTNGCFELLHQGHMALLQEAAALGDVLIVGLNSDDSVSRLKGPGRPVRNQDDRARVLVGISGVDAVLVFNEDTPLELIRRIRPDVLVKGADYEKNEVVGADFVESYGGKVVLVPIVPGYSTSDAIARIRESESPATL